MSTRFGNMEHNTAMRPPPEPDPLRLRALRQEFRLREIS